MIRIVATSDLHGHLPEPGVIPDCDILIIAGDICPIWDHHRQFQSNWLKSVFVQWLDEQPAKTIVGIGGNHDFVLEGHKQKLGYKLSWVYLNNEITEIDGIKIWGSPLSNRFGDWANMKPEPALSDVWKTIPRDINILVTHGPAYGHGDLAPRASIWDIETQSFKIASQEHVGSASLSHQLSYDEWPNLTHHIFGHIHEGYGSYSYDDKKTGLNVSRVNGQYEVINPPMVFDV